MKTFAIVCIIGLIVLAVLLSPATKATCYDDEALFSGSFWKGMFGVQPKNWAAQIGLKDASALSDQKAIKEDGWAAQQVGASVGESLSRPIIRASRGIERISTRRFAN